jgi:hypothetical protein
MIKPARKAKPNSQIAAPPHFVDAVRGELSQRVVAAAFDR